MVALPVISGKECVKAFIRAGFSVVRRHSSHLILRRTSPFAQVTIPDHRTLDRGTLKSILRGAGLSTEEFERFLEG